jgi:hypothetical protein
MDIWAVLTDLGGIDYNAPQRTLSFEPRLNQEDFKSVFVLPSAWGIVTQVLGKQQEQIDTVSVTEGTLTISKLILHAESLKANATVQKGSANIPVKQLKKQGTAIQIELKEAVAIKQGEKLQVEVNPQ